MATRVLITGIGVITPIGIGVQEYWEGLNSGKSAVGYITQFDASQYPCKIAAEVRGFEPENYLDRRQSRILDRFAQFAVAAASQAIDDAKLKIGPDNANEVGVLVGSGIGGIRTWEEQHKILLEKGPGRVSPYLVPMMICDMASGQISITWGCRGPNSCTVTACASSNHAIGDAFEIIRRGDAKVMITGGAEAPISPTAVAGFSSMKALSTRNDEPERASRPFDLTRDGFVIGEGAGILVLEAEEYALSRGVEKVYGEIVGYGLSADAYHITAPDPQGDGAALSMAMALQDASISTKDVHYINAHGTSTPLNDRIETMAIKKVFGEYAYKIPISSTKSMIGHLLGASGAVELIASILAMQKHIIPPTINYQQPDPDCDLDYVPNQARAVATLDVVMSNSFGFGGHNATIIVKRYP